MPVRLTCLRRVSLADIFTTRSCGAVDGVVTKGEGRARPGWVLRLFVTHHGCFKDGFISHLHPAVLFLYFLKSHYAMVPRSYMFYWECILGICVHMCTRFMFDCRHVIFPRHEYEGL